MAAKEVSIDMWRSFHKKKVFPNAAVVTDSQAVFDVVSRYAEAGLDLLKERWITKTRIQIQDDIQKIIS
jgi:hypothetical protein